MVVEAVVAPSTERDTTEIIRLLANATRPEVMRIGWAFGVA